MDNYYIQMIFTAKGSDLDTLQVIVRAVIIFTYTLILFRIAKKRFLGKSTPFDIIMGVVLGSVISRAINGSAKLFPTMAVGLVFLIFHWFISLLVSKSPLMSKLLEGIPFQLIKDGVVDKHALARTHTTDEDILEWARSTAHVNKFDKISDSYLENSGKISIITKEKVLLNQ